MIEVKVVKKSVSTAGDYLTTFQLKYPRFIHAEFMTHRVFSRNASSSRAIPVQKMIDEINTNWAKPIDFRKNKRGMQGGDLLEGEELSEAFKLWELAKDDAIFRAKQFIKLGVHKQYANRLLEPFSHISVVVSATEWDNFFGLRCHHMAQPEIALLAEMMYSEMEKIEAEVLQPGQYHLPYVDAKCKLECREYIEKVDPSVLDIWIKRSVARCARVSYNNHEGKISTVEEDLKLYDRLLGSQPIHASPAEHQAFAVPEIGQSGNFRGWVQYRKTLKGENITNFTPGMFNDEGK